MIYLYHVNSLSYIELKNEVIIGRTQGDLIIDHDSLLSSRHLKIFRQEMGDKNEILVEDLGSKNRSMLDRVELRPNTPVKVSLNSVLEIGEQKFIFSKNNNLKILEINEIIDRNSKQVVTRIEGQKLIEDLKVKMKSELTNLVVLEEKYLAEIKEQESIILKHQHEINQLIEKEKIEFQKLEEQRKKITEEIAHKTSDIKQLIQDANNEISSLHSSIEEIKRKKAEKEQKIATFGKKHD